VEAKSGGSIFRLISTARRQRSTLRCPAVLTQRV
jgi:hypothetical protein